MAVWVFATLYLTAMLVDSSAGLQVTGMLGFERGSDLSIFYGWLYTLSLILAALSALGARKVISLGYIAIILAGISIGLTILPLAFSILYEFNPGHYEDYIGESLTILSLLMVAVAIALIQKPNKPEQAGAVNA